MSASDFIDRVTRWAAVQEDVVALAVVGSHARGTAGPASDIDFVLLCCDPHKYVASSEWVSAFGVAMRTESEEWGLIRSIRVFYENGPEVEFGIGSMAWVASPTPPGTMEVVSDGVAVLLDRDGSLTRLAKLASTPSGSST
jgi:hypothetical protein